MLLVRAATTLFHDEEALYAAVTTTRRAAAVPLDDADSEFGGPLYEGYATPWTIVSNRHADIDRREGRLVEPATETIATEAAGYLGGQ